MSSIASTASPAPLSRLRSESSRRFGLQSIGFLAAAPLLAYMLLGEQMFRFLACWLAALLCWGVMAFRPRWLADWRQSRLFVICLAYIGYLLASFFWSGNEQGAFSYYACAAVLALTFIGFLADSQRRDERFEETGLWCVSLVISAAAVCSLIAYLCSDFYTHRLVRFHPLGGMNNPNLGGPVFVLGMWIAYNHLLKTSKTSKTPIWKTFSGWLAMGQIALLGIALAQTNSRSSFLALAVMLALAALRLQYWRLSPNNWRLNLGVWLPSWPDWRLGWLAAALAAGCVIRYFLIMPFILNQLAAPAAASPTDNFVRRADNGRFALWKESLDKFQQRPWLGYGLGANMRYWAAGSYGHIHPHNIQLSCLNTGGVPALLLFWLLMAQMGRTAYRIFQRRGDFFWLGWLVFVIVCTQFDHYARLDEVNINWFLFWLPCGYLIAAELREHSQEAPAPS